MSRALSQIGCDFATFPAAVAELQRLTLSSNWRSWIRRGQEAGFLRLGGYCASSAGQRGIAAEAWAPVGSASAVLITPVATCREAVDVIDPPDW
jgi:hypothetical protein